MYVTVENMKKQNIIKENKEYNRIIQNIKPYKYKEFILYVDKNNYINYEFGFSIGKKIGNAVTRNKIRRQIKNIIDKRPYQNGFKCIIMVRKSILNKTYQEIEKNLLDALDKVNIYRGEF